MASERQIDANRRNAMRSTGPQTALGKRRARRNAYRHGLTSETVVATLEEATDYERLQSSLMQEYNPHTVIEQQLVARLASLLWRLRRSTLIETGLFEAHAGTLNRQQAEICGPLAPFYQFLRDPSGKGVPVNVDVVDRKRGLAAIYLSLCKTQASTLKRLGRYETALWRQLAQTLLLLDNAVTAQRRLNRIAHAAGR